MKTRILPTPGSVYNYVLQYYDETDKQWRYIAKYDLLYFAKRKAKKLSKLNWLMVFENGKKVIDHPVNND